MFWVNMVFFLSSFIYICNKQDITSIYQHFIIIQSDQDRCPLKVTDTIEYMNRQEKSREDPD